MSLWHHCLGQADILASLLGTSRLQILEKFPHFRVDSLVKKIPGGAMHRAMDGWERVGLFYHTRLEDHLQYDSLLL